MFHWNKQSFPIVALSPMAGVTDSAYRRIIKKIAPDVLLYTEFVSTNALHHGSDKAHRMLSFDEGSEHPIIVQVFGNDRRIIEEACKIAEEQGADGIDINMGCPAGKIVSSCYGSALLRKPALAAEIVHAASHAVRIPISVKTRLGWEDAENLSAFGKLLEEAGAAAIAIHGRTYRQQYKGEADWAPIYKLKEHLHIPVLGNGDITTSAQALDRIGTLQGVLIGRAAVGNPWLLRDISSLFKNAESAPPPPPSLGDVCSIMMEHYALSVALKGEMRGITEMRKYIGGYIKGFNGAKEIRMRMMHEKTLPGIESVLQSLK